MKKNDYLIYSGVLFTIVAIAHALRIFLDWGLVIGTWNAPMWVSWIALVVTGYLAYSAMQLKK